jgi:hypothetical protein
LEYVLDPHPPTLSVADRIAHSIARLRRYHNTDFFYSRIFEIVEDVKKNWPISHRHELFSSGVRQWAEPGSPATAQHEPFQVSSRHLLKTQLPGAIAEYRAGFRHGYISGP